MKTLLLILVSISLFAQSGTITPGTYHPGLYTTITPGHLYQPGETKVIGTKIAIYFSFNSKDEKELKEKVLSSINEVEYLRQWVLFLSREQDDIKFKSVAVRAEIAGKKKDYTFFEFYKLIWQ